MAKVLVIHTMDGKRHIASELSNDFDLGGHAREIANEKGTYYETGEGDFGFVPARNIARVEQVEELAAKPTVSTFEWRV